MVSILEACKALGMPQQVLALAEEQDEAFVAGGCPIASMSSEEARYWLGEYAVAVGPDEPWAHVVVNSLVQHALQAQALQAQAQAQA